MGLFTLPEGLAPELYPLAWLVGTWRGEGTVGYPGIAPFAIDQVAHFTHDGGPYLRYETTVRQLDSEGQPESVWHAESGYWRIASPAPAGPAAGPGQAARGQAAGTAPASGSVSTMGTGTGTGTAAAAGPTAPPAQPSDAEPEAVDLECLLADPAGYVTVYLGQVKGPRIDLASDLLARTATAAEVTAASRLYGLVESDLLWAWDLAAFGHPLQSYLAARLERQASAPGEDA